MLKDHPRMRGEHYQEIHRRSSNSGSSPHARGALLREDLGGLYHGIIPACAGSTPATAPAACNLKDHPRMRGEHPPARK